MDQGNKAGGIFVFFHGLFFFFWVEELQKMLDGMFEGASFSEVQKFRIHELSKGWFGH